MKQPAGKNKLNTAEEYIHWYTKKSNLTYDEVRNRYEHFRARCANPKKNKIFPFRKTQKKEKGCTESLYGKKSKCVLKIVPQDEKCNTFQMDKQCEKKRVYYK